MIIVIIKIIEIIIIMIIQIIIILLPYQTIAFRGTLLYGYRFIIIRFHHLQLANMLPE